MNAKLSEALKKLRLSGILQTLEVRLQEAAANRLSHSEFLELILQDELAVRHDRLVSRRTKSASFRDQKSLEDFDWDFIRYYILSRYVSGRRFADPVRSHWGVENSLHWQLDVTFSEDQSRLRKGHADTNFSILRRTALSLLKSESTANVATSGFFNMVKTHSQYRATQVIWECKNYESLKSDDFQQASYYMGGALGNLCFLCFRGDPKERHYYEHIRHVHATKNGGLVLLLADADLKVFLRQAKNGKTKDGHIQNRFNETTRLIG